MPTTYRESQRFYRYQHQEREGWVSFQTRYRETDLWIRAQRSLEQEALEAVLNCRRQLEEYISHHPEFLPSLAPLPEGPSPRRWCGRCWRRAGRQALAPWLRWPAPSPRQWLSV